MGRREKLHSEFVQLLGSTNVYFQPPESLKLKYPCIVYFETPSDQKYADDKTYLYTRHYDVIFINNSPDGIIIIDRSKINIVSKLIRSFSMIRHSRHYTSGNLYQDAFSLYY